MPHPFFDTVNYPWRREDAQAAYKALYTAIHVPGQIQLLCQQCPVELLPLTLNQSPDLIWKEALEKLAAAASLKWLCELVLKRQDLASCHPALRALIEAQDLVDALEEQLPSADLVFLDRKKLRTELRRIAPGNAPVRVLLIRGSRACGKSWTQRLIERLASSSGEESIYLYEGQISTVDDVLDWLFTVLGAPGAAPQRGLETEDAWFRKACLKLMASAQGTKKRWWVVVDDLGVGPDGPRLDPIIKRFFDQFGLLLADPSFAKWFRLVLIDYPEGPVPTKWKSGFWVEDRPDETEVQDEAVSQFLLSWAQGRKKQLAAEDAKKLAQDVLAKAALPPPPDDARSRLQRIHDALLAVLETL